MARTTEKPDCIVKIETTFYREGEPLMAMPCIDAVIAV